MNKIMIRLQSPYDSRKLFISPDDPKFENLVLFIENGIKKPFIYSINIRSGGILIYLDKDRIIQGADFNIPRKSWQPESHFMIPVPAKEAVISVINVSRKHETLDIPIKSLTDINYNWVFFYWGESTPIEEWVMLSDQVFGLIQNNYLMGFFIKLTQEPSS